MKTQTPIEGKFPLTKHPQGYYCKRILGKLHYFGKRNCPPLEALEDYLRKRPYLEAGAEVPKEVGVTVEEALDKFLEAKHKRLKAGELSRSTFDEYTRQCKRILLVVSRVRSVASICVSDFDRLFSSFRGCPKTIEGYVTRSKTAFRWVEKQYGLKFNYGDQFRKPSARSLRNHRNSQPKRLFEPAELRTLLSKASPKMKAMILLGINCGFGNEDCATLTVDKLDLVGGWHSHARPKTGIERRGKLWPETVAALEAVVPESGLVFLTRYGNPYSDGSNSSPIGSEFRKLADKHGCQRTFYDLRRTFQTVADDARDPVAVKFVMGHLDSSMSGVYRQLVPDKRLFRVAKTVRVWLGISARKAAQPGG